MSNRVAVKKVATFCGEGEARVLFVSDTLKRDQAAALAKTSIKQATAKARSIEDPWYHAQALAWVARFSAANAVEFAAEASSAVRKCDDAYKRVAVRAWRLQRWRKPGVQPRPQSRSRMRSKTVSM